MNTTSDDFSRQLQSVLRPHLKLLAPDAPLSPSEPLGDLGLDSTAAINLLLDLEAAFDIQIPEDLLSAETFETLTSLDETFRPLIEQRADR